MRKLTRNLAPLSMAAVLALAGCGELCTEVGCDYPNAVEVRFDRGLTASDAFDLVIEPSDGANASRWRCEDRACTVVEGGDAGRFEAGPGIRANLRDARPDTVVITIESGGQSTATDHVLEYDRSYPNGESCGPTCRTAVVQVLLPR